MSSKSKSINSESGSRKIKVEIREFDNYRALFFDGVLFDWGMNPEELEEAKKFCGQDPFHRKTIHGDLCRFFLKCLSEVLGKEVTIKEVNAAIEQGSIEI